MAEVSTILTHWLSDKIDDFSTSPTCLHIHFKPPVQIPPPPPPPKKIEPCRPPINFELTIDVHQYSAEEIRVSTVNNVIVVEAKHEEKHGEHGHVTREFLRRCTVPPTSDITKATAFLSADGVLKITAPKKSTCCKPGERIIPIEQTGRSACK
ncbi:protein lethal(2)essential for life-like [Neodiprion pinetum]|uniref:Protein lethal(2)essential for life n=1 Tax=Neodiprion lecontei TaxID=441921 RepID=A0A6J0C2P4_NEOLC|nr:protein lethal(2)essential for life [Neodiprion lecontei]XP_046435477.1 protein lethal(2)essential for life-like [Neodiprion fabricii]XP_046492214.1 protein lethal(2)essential for life-like [Neodiprion pinetum]XP_046629353.1 protein lethal(2)essential for life-like [Neodiprion virginianus]